MAAPRLLELAHHVAAGLRRALPVDVPPLVARHVLAERVERHVALGEVASGGALQVADEPGAHARDGDDARMHEQVERVGPHHLAAQQTDRIGPNRAHRADRDDAAPAGRHDEDIRVLLAAEQCGCGELGESLADRNLHAHAGQTPTGRVAHAHLARCPISHDDAVGRERQPHVVDDAAHQVERRDEQEGRGRPARHDGFRPAQDVTGDERESRHRRHRPAEGRDDRSEHAGSRRHRPADGRAGAHDPDDRVGEQPVALADDAGAGVGELDLGAGDGAGHTAARSLGGGTSINSCPTTLEAVTPSNSASGSSTSRCASTGSASAFTSSGVT